MQQCKCQFVVTEIIDFIHLTCFYSISQMEMKDRGLIGKINPTFIALTMTAIYHCLFVWKIGIFRVTPECGPGGGVQDHYNTRSIHHVDITAYTVQFCSIEMDCYTSSPKVQIKWNLEYLQYDLGKDLLNWYRPRYGTTSKCSGQHWWGVLRLHPGAADGAPHQFF